MNRYGLERIMSGTVRIVVLLPAMLLALGSVSEAGISRVARRLNVVELHASYAHPVGSYDHISIINFENSQGRIVDLDADKVYDPTLSVGLTYGQLRGNHFLYSIGFCYTHIRTLDSFYVEPGLAWIFQPETPTFNQYDIDFNLNYFLSNPSVAVLAPFFGVGFHGGITSETGDLIESENEVTVALGVNFGVDLTVWKAKDGRSLLTLSSVNEYQVAASDDRPRYLNVGIGVKYYYRP